MEHTDTFKTMLANCLRESADSYTIQAVMREFPTVRELMNATAEDMILIKGINKTKARQIAAILHFIRYIQGSSDNQQPIIRSPEDVYNLLRRSLEYLTVEQFIVLGLSTKNHVIIQHTVSIGSLNASVVHPREAFKMLIRCSCASVILAHNHPSGDPKPSDEDIALTKRLIETGQIIDIPVLDHIIIGQGSYVSLKEKGII